MNSRDEEEEEEVGIVMSFAQNNPKNWKKMKFGKHIRKHPVKGETNNPIYYMKSELNDNVLHIGEEVSQFGMDYCIATIDKDTGQVTYKPAKLYQCTSKYVQDTETFLGEKPAPKTEYGQDYMISDSALRLEKRKALIMEFGSAKKKRLQASFDRRIVKDDTLKAVIDSAMSQVDSTTNSSFIKKEQGDEKSLIASISQKAESSVLPKANKDAKLPREVYGIDFVVSDKDIEELDILAKEIVSKDVSQLKEEGFPPFIIQCYRTLSFKSSIDKQKQAVGLLMLTAMIEICALVPGRKSFVYEQELQNIHVPSDVYMKIVARYLGECISKARKGSTAARGDRYNCSGKMIKDRLLAHTLALALTLADDFSLHVPDWTKMTKLAETKVLPVLKALGCKVNDKQGVNVAILTGPPSQKTPMKSNRRKTR